jgi:hypothetical protein
MKGLLTAVAVLVSFVLTAGIALALVLVFAGPHSDILPKWSQWVVVVLGWVTVIGVPFIAGRSTWRRLHRGGVAREGAQGDGVRPPVQ